MAVWNNPKNVKNVRWPEKKRKSVIKLVSSFPQNLKIFFFSKMKQNDCIKCSSAMLYKNPM